MAQQAVRPVIVIRQNGLRAPTLDDRAEPFNDRGNRFLPRNAFEARFAFWPDAALRMEDAGGVIDAPVELPDLVADEPLGIGMRTALGRRRLDARDLSFRDDDLQRAGVWTIHGASRANSFAHKGIVTIAFAGCTSIRTRQEQQCGFVQEGLHAQVWDGCARSLIKY